MSDVSKHFLSTLVNPEKVELSHWSANPINSVYSVQQGGKDARNDKPKGLWVSVDGPYDWLWWNDLEEFYDLSKQHRYKIQLSPLAKILYIRNSEDLHRFDTEFHVPLRGTSDRWSIDWQRVANYWQGIVIAPYLWSERLGGISWYYGWDCASGSIWDKSAIDSLALRGDS